MTRELVIVIAAGRHDDSRCCSCVRVPFRVYFRGDCELGCEAEGRWDGKVRMENDRTGSSRMEKTRMTECEATIKDDDDCNLQLNHEGRHRYVTDAKQHHHKDWLYKCPQCFLEKPTLYELQGTRCKR